MARFSLPPPPPGIMEAELSEAIEIFLSTLTAVGMSPKTVKAYSAALKSFASFVGPGRRASLVGHADYIRWLTHISSGGGLRGRGGGRASRSTLHYYSVFVRRFLRWVGVKGELPAVPRGRRGFSYALGWEEVRRLLESSRDLTDLLIVSLLAETGLRVSELLSLRAGDVDLERGLVRVRGKYGRARIAFLGPVGRAALSRYLSYHRVPRGARIIGLTYQAVYKRLKRMAERGGLDPSRVRPHVLRHTFATEALKRGMSLPALQRLLGHSDIKITQLYLHLTPEDVRREYERAFYAPTTLRRLPDHEHPALFVDS